MLDIVRYFRRLQMAVQRNLNKVWTQSCNFIKKETLTQVFSCEFCKILRTPFLQNTSSGCFYSTIPSFLAPIKNQLISRKKCFDELQGTSQHSLREIKMFSNKFGSILCISRSCFGCSWTNDQEKLIIPKLMIIIIPKLFQLYVLTSFRHLGHRT